MIFSKKYFRNILLFATVFVLILPVLVQAKKKTYAIFSLEEPKLIRIPGSKVKVKKFPLPPGAKRTTNKKEEIKDQVGELQVFYVNMDIVKVREFYKQALGTEGRVYSGNPNVSAGGTMITIPVEEGYVNPITQKSYPTLLLFGAKLSWTYDASGKNGQTRIMVQVIKDKDALAKDLTARENFRKKYGTPQPYKGK